MKTLVFSVILTLPVYGQDAKKSDAPPAISEAQLVDFFQAQSDLATAVAVDFVSKAAKEDFDTKSTTFSTEVGKLSKLCGASFDLQLNDKRRPICAPKQVAFKAPESIGAQEKK